MTRALRFALTLLFSVACSSGLPQPLAADFIGHGAPVRDLAISSDGRRALTAGFDDQAILWDVESKELRLRLLGHAAAVNAVAFVPPDDNRAVTTSDDGSLRLWDLAQGQELAVWRGHKLKVVSVALSPDGRFAASASWDRTVRLWDVARGQEIARYEGHEGSVNAVAFLPDRQGIVSAGYDGALWRWPLPGNTGEARLADIGFPISDLALSPDGQHLLTGSSDGALRIWDWREREELNRLEGHDGAVLTVAYGANGSFASGGTDGQLLLWDQEPGTARDNPRRRVSLDHYRAVWSLAFSPDATVVYAAGTDPVVRAWYVESGKSLIGNSTPYQATPRASLAAADSDDPIERGSYQFRKCAICHSLVEDGVVRAGPSLEGLFGRRIGSYPGYIYSQALRGSTLIWNEETVGKLFELGPNVFLPGTKMPLQKLPDPQARADLIAFLKANTQHSP